MSDSNIIIASVFLIMMMSPVIQTSENLELLILHNNDMHSRYAPINADSTACLDPDRTKCYGGFARTAHVIKSYRAQQNKGGRPVLYLNAGDTFQGSSWFAVHGAKIAIDFLNRLKPNVTSLGNHEFDLGFEGIVRLVNGAQFPIVAANLDFSEEPDLSELYIPSSVVLEVNGHQIGVIGYLTPQTRLIGYVGEIVFIDEVESLRRESERLDAEGVKIIIALGHSGFAVDKMIAEQVPLVDLVIGGHTNTFLWNGDVKPDSEEIKGAYPTIIRQPSGKKVPVVQAYAHTKYMGRLNVTFDPSGGLIACQGDPLLLDGSVAEDPEFLKLLQKYAIGVSAANSLIVGQSRVKLDSTSHSCLFEECNFGNFVADAFVAYHAYNYKGQYWTDAAIGFVNSGSIRGNIDPEGNVTRGDLITALPFELQVTQINVTGEMLMRTLECSASAMIDPLRGDFLQVSGMKVTYDFSRPEGQRVADVRVRCRRCKIPIYERLNRSDIYGIVTNTYVARGESVYHFYRVGTIPKKMEPMIDVDVVAWYLEKMSPVAPEISGRLLFVGSRQRVSESSANMLQLAFSSFIALQCYIVLFA